jgi:hypothetical protein
VNRTGSLGSGRLYFAHRAVTCKAGRLAAEIQGNS